MKTRISTNKILIASILIIFSAIIFYFSYFNVWQGDDLNYRMIITSSNYDSLFDGDKVPVSSLYDIAVSQICNYQYINGRVPAHFLVQLFCGIYGHFWFALLNSVFYIAFVYLILSLSKADLWNTKSLLSAIALVVFCISTKFSPSCQIGYIWTFTVILGFIKIFFSQRQINKLWLPIIFVYSVLAGWSQEALAIGVGGALIIFFLLKFRNMSLLQWVSMFGFGIGGLLLCLSPAMLHRASGIHITAFMSILNLILGLRAFYILVIISSITVLRNKKSIFRYYKQNSFFINAIIILFIFNLCIGVTGNRQLLGIEILSVLLIIRLLKNHSFNRYILIVGYVFIGCQLGIQANITNQNYKSYNEMAVSYQHNNDGTAYLRIPDIKAHRFLLMEDYCAPLSLLLKGDYPIITQRNEFFANYGKKKHFMLIPKQLENNGILMQSSARQIAPGEFLFIENESHPAEFLVHRSLQIAGIKIPYTPINVPLDSVRYRSDNWRARVFGTSDMQRIVVDSVSVKLKIDRP